MANGVNWSMKDLLLLREAQDQADPVKSGLMALVSTVGNRIEEAREEKKKQRELENHNAAQLQQFDNRSNTNSSKMIGKLTFKDGKYTYSETSESDAQRASRIKNQQEVENERQHDAVMDAFIGGDKSVTRGHLIRIGKTAKEADDLLSARDQGLLGTVNDDDLDAAIGNTERKIQRTSDININIPKGRDIGSERFIAPKRTGSGLANEIIDLKDTRTLKELEGKISTGTAIDTDVGKRQTEMSERMRSIEAGINLTKMSYADAVAYGRRELHERGIDVDPSRGIEGKIIFPLMNRLVKETGNNPLFDAFDKGMAIELAPELGKAADQGTRLSKAIIDAFRKTIPALERFESTAEGAQQLILSGTNAFRKEAARTRDADGNFIYATSQDVEQAVVKFQEGLTRQVYKYFTAVGAYTPKTVTKKGKDGTPYTIPDFLIPEFNRKFSLEVQ